MKCIQLIAVLVMTNLTYGQTSLSGRIINEAYEPIPFVNMGIIAMNLATLSEENGQFTMDFRSAEISNQFIKIEHVGYKDTSVSVLHLLLTDNQIILKARDRKLETIEINTTEKSDNICLGSGHFGMSAWLLLDTLGTGESFALLVDNTNSLNDTMKYYAKKVELGMGEIKDCELRFGLRICAVDSSTGLPGQDLLPTPVIKTFEIKERFYHLDYSIQFDISDFGLVIEQPVFIVIEHLQLDSERDETKAFLDEYKKKHPRLVLLKETVKDGDTLEFESYMFITNKLPIPAISRARSKNAVKNSVVLTKSSTNTPWKPMPFVPDFRICGAILNQ